MPSNSTGSAVASDVESAVVSVMEMEVIAIISFVLTIISTLMSGFFLTNAVMGVDKPTGYYAPPKEWGKPWEFSLATAMDGASKNGSVKLEGGGGPFPNVHLFNDMGDYLGTNKNDNLYAMPNRALSLEVFPNNVHEHEGQFATFAILEAKGNGRDPLCIVDMGLGRPNTLDKEKGNGFGAATAISCGAAWYYSGVYRDYVEGSTPCFWLGGYGTQGMQVHLPSHTVGQTAIDINEINGTEESSHDYFCDHPGILSLWETLPEPHKVPGLLITDLEKRAGRTIIDTIALHKKNDLMQPGTRRLTSRGIPDPHEDTVTIAHKVKGLSAINLCENALSMGPDYVNIPEGKFCRMSDKTLWPTCDHQNKVGPRDDCFDVDSRQLVVGGKVTRGKPYNREINFPLED